MRQEAVRIIRARRWPVITIRDCVGHDRNSWPWLVHIANDGSDSDQCGWLFMILMSQSVWLQSHLNSLHSYCFGGYFHTSTPLWVATETRHRVLHNIYSLYTSQKISSIGFHFCRARKWFWWVPCFLSIKQLYILLIANLRWYISVRTQENPSLEILTDIGSFKGITIFHSKNLQHRDQGVTVG